MGLVSGVRKGLREVRVTAFLYTYKLLKRGRKLAFQGREYDYFYNRYNLTFSNERVVEIPIAWNVVRAYDASHVLEVGNVLSHYYPVKHDVLDKYETAAGVVNEDVVDFQPSKRYDLIVAVSTLEHVGWDEEPREPAKFLRAVEHLTELLAPGGKLFVTLPIDYNAAVDEYLKDGKIPFTTVGYVKRISDDNRWRECGWDEVAGMRYQKAHRNRWGVVISATATGLVVGSIEKPVS
ncbi:MAG TPA: hypothetical protein VJN88_01085 [Ktedonobacterales bacterium]|nr:hypothetical protein [Ktedonobacterales bacterium]